MVSFYDIHFRSNNPKVFLKAPLAPIFINFEGEARTEKSYFLVRIFQKVCKNAFLSCFFFQNFASKILPLKVLFDALGELAKLN